MTTHGESAAQETKQEEKPVHVAAPAVPLVPGVPPTPAALAPIVVFDKVTKTYDDGFTAIKDVTFCVDDKPNEMEFVTILGPSGCGKSTILRLIAGLRPQHPATSGTVHVSGRPVLGPGANRGMVFQDYTSFDNRTVEDNVAFGLECRGVPAKERREQARTWIGKVGLNVDRDSTKYPHQLSGGMRQRVAIARSLILGPKIILMDEPFGALDPRTRLNMQDMLVSLSREAQATVFFVTHSIEEAVYLGDRTFIISSAPGTILRDMPVPPPDFPARAMQQQPKFMEVVFEIRDIMEGLESSTRAGDE
jgi:ABC-type nitrate/sulfonate/bicarbonate transport system ATPase subunit